MPKFRIIKVYEARTNDEFELVHFQEDTVRALATKLKVGATAIYNAIKRNSLVNGYKIHVEPIEYYADEDDFGQWILGVQ